MTHYRIVTNRYGSYSIEFKHAFWPFWTSVSYYLPQPSLFTIEDAQERINRWKEQDKFKKRVVG